MSRISGGMEYEIGMTNHLGTRNSNQDRFAIVETPDGVLLALADGMGGIPGGDRAAQMLVDVARIQYGKVARPLRDPRGFFRGVLLYTHEALVSLARAGNSSKIPATTAVLALLQNGRLDWAHIGDSRLYLFRQGRLAFRTTDHSYVEELLRQGRIDSAQGEKHPRRGHITRCLGAMPQLPDVEIGEGMQLEEGDVIMLCSDGLWNAVNDDDMAAAFGPRDALDDGLEKMAMYAEQASYPHTDNISAIALRVRRLNSLSPLQPPADTALRPEDKHMPVDESRLQNAIASIEEALRTYRDELEK